MKIAIPAPLARQLLLLGALVLLVLVPVSLAGLWIYGRHQAAQEALDTLAPRYRAAAGNARPGR